MGYIIMIQQYMVSLRGIIISNGVINKAPSDAVIGIITCNGTSKRIGLICWRTWDITRSLKWRLI